MSDPLVLIFDIGTQSARCALIDRQGRFVLSRQANYPQPYLSPRPNWAEQRPEFYFEQMCALSRSLRQADPAAFARIEAMSLTCIRDSTVCLGKDGRPLRNAILWMDQRTAEHPRPLPGYKRALFALVGMTDTVETLQRTAACNYLAEKEAELWAKTDKYLCLSTYLNYRFTGRAADSTASVLAKMPYDYRRRRWDEHGLLREAYDIPSRMLCELVPSGTVIAGVTAEAAALSGLPEGLPVIVSGSDKGCETVGLGVIGEGAAALSFGTSCTVELSTSRYVEPSPFMPAYPAVPNDRYNPEVQIYRGYWMLTWYKENFARDLLGEAERRGVRVEELLDEHLGEIPAGSEGLMVLPHWTPGLATPHSRGAMLGFTDVHTRYHIYRALIEGVNFGLMEGLRGMERRSGQSVTLLRLGGGGSRSAAIAQLTADMFGLPLERTEAEDASALGAAVCLWVALGVYGDYPEAVARMVRRRDRFEPREREHGIYEALYKEAFLPCYKTLRPLHKSLGRLTER